MRSCSICQKPVEPTIWIFCPYCGGALSTSSTPPHMAASIITAAAEKAFNVREGTLADRLIGVAAQVVESQIHQQIGPMAQLLAKRLVPQGQISSATPPSWYIDALREARPRPDATSLAISDAEAVTKARLGAETTKNVLETNRSMMNSILKGT